MANGRGSCEWHGFSDSLEFMALPACEVRYEQVKYLLSLVPTYGEPIDGFLEK